MMTRSDQPSLDLVIFALLIGCILMGILGHFGKSQDSEMVRDVTSALTTGLTAAVGAKFGLSRQAQQPSVEHPKENGQQT
jgi:hypothetical protein